MGTDLMSRASGKYILATYLQERGDDLSPLERAKHDCTEGRISELEFERRLDHLLDDRNEQIREVVSQFENQLGDAEWGNGKAATVYYLHGDERRAVRRYIEANEEIVADALAQRRNRFQVKWSDFLYGLLEEEWRFWLCR